MTDDQIIALAESLGWNVEHAETNRMLILFARDIEDCVRATERKKLLEVCKEGLWDAGGIRNHLEQHDAIRSRT